jgi:hypothetical protein
LVKKLCTDALPCSVGINAKPFKTALAHTAELFHDAPEGKPDTCSLMHRNKAVFPVGIEQG